MPFQETYVGTQDIPREAKHNFFARQINDDQLDADVYLLTHLENPGKKKSTLPGTRRQRKWILYVLDLISQSYESTL